MISVSVTVIYSAPVFWWVSVHQHWNGLTVNNSKNKTKQIATKLVPWLHIFEYVCPLCLPGCWMSLTGKDEDKVARGQQPWIPPTPSRKNILDHIWCSAGEKLQPSALHLWLQHRQPKYANQEVSRKHIHKLIDNVNVLTSSKSYKNKNWVVKKYKLAL